MNVFEKGLLKPPQTITPEQFEKLSNSEKRRVISTLQQIHEVNSGRDILNYFPATGNLSRDKYPKHMEFFRAGSKYKEILFMAANRTGKSFAAGYLCALHLMGYYPDWWEGFKFKKPVKMWASSKTSMMTRDFVQRYLTGEWGKFGTGFIPRDCIIDFTPKRGIPEAVDTLRVKSRYGESEVVFKSYDQGWDSYQGASRDLIWNDEECPMLVHNECLTRLMTTEGHYILTFTPLSGLTEVVRSYLGDSLKITNDSPHSYVVNCTWDDVPHLSAEEKARQIARTPPHILDAKSKGIPVVGSGAIYPVPESDIVVDPFKIPAWWPKCFAMDVGWNRTAALWGALDRESDTLYLYSEYYRGQAEPSVHADAIKARGSWIPGVIDPASRGRNQKDGSQLYNMYQDLGLDISKSKNAVEAGIYEVWQRLSTGRIKVFANLKSVLTEFRMYQRDENGKILKKDDHLMDCLRYLILSGLSRAIIQSEAHGTSYGDVRGFTPVDSVTGY